MARSAPCGTSLPTNKMVGGLFPNDGDGNAWGDPKLGFPPVLAQKGFQLVDPGRFQSLTDDFWRRSPRSRRPRSRSSPVWSFRRTSDLLDPGAQQGFKPKDRLSVGKALLFPGAVEALGKAGNSLSTEIWWSPTHPFSRH